MSRHRVSTSLAVIILVCFFLPWVQVSCGGSRDTITAIDLARDGHAGLWLIPALMILVVFVTLSQRWKERPEILATVPLLASLITSYLMNRERSRFNHDSSLLAVSLTGWFWLGFVAAILLVLVSVYSLLKRSPPD